MYKKIVSKQQIQISVFSLTRTGLKPTIYAMVGGHIFQQRTSNDGKRSHGHLAM
jgi:hypothetical protein